MVGKSTIVDLILQVHRPTFGGIYIDGIPAVLINTDHLRRQIGVVHQVRYFYLIGNQRLS